MGRFFYFFFFSVMLSLSKHPGEAACLATDKLNPRGGKPNNKNTPSRGIRKIRGEEEKFVSTRFLGFARNDTIFFFSVMLSLSKHPGEAACLATDKLNPRGGKPNNKNTPSRGIRKTRGEEEKYVSTRFLGLLGMAGRVSIIKEKNCRIGR